METLNKIEIAARNKGNYLKAKEAFNNKRVDDFVQFYAPDHEVKSKQSEKGRAGIQAFLEGLHQTWPDIQITVEHSVAEDDWVMGRSCRHRDAFTGCVGRPANRQKDHGNFLGSAPF